MICSVKTEILNEQLREVQLISKMHLGQHETTFSYDSFSFQLRTL